MTPLRNLIALLVLASSTLALSQNTPIKVMVSVAPGGPIDMTARNMGKNLQASSGRGFQVTNVVGEFGARAVQEFRSAPADGNQILVLHATPGQPAPDVAGLVPIAIIVGESSRYRWVGVFAPPGTPAGIARELERAVLGALRSPDLRQVAGLSLSPGDGASLARLVAQSAGGGNTAAGSPTAAANAPAARPVQIAQAPVAVPPMAGAVGKGWPAGAEPGNMYLVEYTDWQQAALPLMVSARSSQDALFVVTQAWDAFERLRKLPPDPRDRRIFKVVSECAGPGWAAVVEYSEYVSKKTIWGAVCGVETPGEAIEKAARACTARGAGSCDPVAKQSEIIVTVGHAGAKGWNPGFSSHPSPRMNFAAFAATSRQLDNYSSVSSVRDAIEKLDKVCDQDYGKRPCFHASTKWACISGTSLKDLSSCVEPRLTSAGYK